MPDTLSHELLFHRTIGFRIALLAPSSVWIILISSCYCCSNRCSGLQSLSTYLHYVKEWTGCKTVLGDDNLTIFRKALQAISFYVSSYRPGYGYNIISVRLLDNPLTNPMLVQTAFFYSYTPQQDQQRGIIGLIILKSWQ